MRRLIWATGMLLLGAFAHSQTGNLLFNGDFELGVNSAGECLCPDGFDCENNAGRVVQGLHPLFDGRDGCSSPTSAPTNNPLGGHCGSAYVHTYSSKDKVQTSNTLFFPTDTTLDLCVWYAGPQEDTARSAQNSENAFFKFLVDGEPVGDPFYVPQGTPWTEGCFRVKVAAGAHTFGLEAGKPFLLVGEFNDNQFHIWFDDFSVEYACTRVFSLFCDNTVSGCSDPGVTLDITSSIPSTYNWVFPDLSSHSGAIQTVTTTGFYAAEVENDCGVHFGTIFVDVTASPNLELGPDTTLCSGEILSVPASPWAAPLLWEDSTTRSFRILNEPGLYWAKHNKRDATHVTPFYWNTMS